MFTTFIDQLGSMQQIAVGFHFVGNDLGHCVFSGLARVSFIFNSVA